MNAQTRTKARIRTLGLVALLASAAALSVATSSSPPAIDRVSPGIGSSSVPIYEPLVVELERPVDGDTVTEETVRLRRVATGELVEATLELAESNHQIRLVPRGLLSPAADYELELDLARLTDRDGNHYVGLRYDESHQSVWETSGLLRVPFTTRRALTVGRAFVGEDANELILYFSEAIDAEGLTGEAVTLTGPDGPVAVDLRFTAEKDRLRVLPLSPLAAGQLYTLALSGDIQTPDGARLAGGAGEQLPFRIDDERIR